MGQIPILNLRLFFKISSKIQLKALTRKPLTPKPEAAPSGATEARFTYIHASKLRPCLRTQTSEKPKGPATSPITLFRCLNTKR